MLTHSQGGGSISGHQLPFASSKSTASAFKLPQGRPVSTQADESHRLHVENKLADLEDLCAREGPLPAGRVSVTNGFDWYDFASARVEPSFSGARAVASTSCAPPGLAAAVTFIDVCDNDPKRWELPWYERVRAGYLQGADPVRAAGRLLNLETAGANVVLEVLGRSFAFNAPSSCCIRHAQSGDAGWSCLLVFSPVYVITELK